MESILAATPEVDVYGSVTAFTRRAGQPTRASFYPAQGQAPAQHQKSSSRPADCKIIFQTSKRLRRPHHSQAIGGHSARPSTVIQQNLEELNEYTQTVLSKLRHHQHPECPQFLWVTKPELPSTSTAVAAALGAASGTSHDASEFCLAGWISTASNCRARNEVIAQLARESPDAAGSRPALRATGRPPDPAECNVTRSGRSHRQRVNITTG
jgi:hypothetical protein